MKGPEHLPPPGTLLHFVRHYGLDTMGLDVLGRTDYTVACTVACTVASFRVEPISVYSAGQDLHETGISSKLVEMLI